MQRNLSRLGLLIIDELGFVPLSPTGAELLFEVFSQRYERGSILVTTNLPFDEWTEVFGSERLTGALLDRLTHHVHILEMNGDSYRLKHNRETAASQAPDDTGDGYVAPETSSSCPVSYGGRAMPKSKNVVIRVTPKQAERWRQAAALAGAEHYTSWAREQVDAAVRRTRRNPSPESAGSRRTQGPGPQNPGETGAVGEEDGTDETPES